MPNKVKSKLNEKATRIVLTGDTGKTECRRFQFKKKWLRRCVKRVRVKKSQTELDIYISSWEARRTASLLLLNGSKSVYYENKNSLKW